MAKKVQVGQSIRTPMKHDLLRKLVGREVGILARVFTNHRHYKLIDLCAGNGSGELSSPAVLTKYARNLFDEGGRVSTTFVERHANTFRELRSWIDAVNPPYICKLYNCESFDISPSELWDDPKCDFAFILNDPNTINDFALTKEMLDAAPPLTTTLSTLGCNPSGNKMLGRDTHRDGWFDKVNIVLDFLPRHHEAMLVKLNKDPAQWAYLVTGPQKWFNDGRYQREATAAFSPWEKGIELVLARCDRQRFDATCRELFLTKKERDNDA